MLGGPSSSTNGFGAEAAGERGTMVDDGDNSHGPAQENGGRARVATPDVSRAAVDCADQNVGEVFGGTYIIEARIGGGGMGVVYRARDQSAGEPVVIKLLNGDRLDDPASVQRFEREARTLNRLDHPNVVSTRDFGSERGMSYIAMEYVDGEQLGEAVQRNHGFEVGRFLDIAEQLLDGVGRAHREGLVHRDLKPSNIMLTDPDDAGERLSEVVKVLDFGLAKLVSGEEDVTKEQSLVGSLPYLAPEQIEGDSIDQRVDVYALGIVFYYMLAARKPFRGDNTSILYDQIHSEPPPLRLHVPEPDAVPEEIYDLIDTCLAKDPDDRPTDATAVLRELRWIAEQTPEREPGKSSARPDPDQREPEAFEQDPSSSELVERRPETSDQLTSYRDADRPVKLGEEEEAPTDNLSQRAGRVASGVVDDDTHEPDDSLSVRGWVTVVSGSIAVVGLGLLLVWSFEETTPAATAADQSNQKTPRIERRLDRIEGLVADGELDGATRLLDETIATAANPDRYEERITEVQHQLHVARLYREALEAKRRRQFRRARRLLGRVDRQQSNYRKTDQLQAELSRYGRLRIETGDDHLVRIDGREAGTTPVEVWLQPGRHDVIVPRKEGQPWRGAIRLGRGETVSLEPDLESEPSPHAPPTETPDAQNVEELSTPAGESAGP